jgi:hypothetical protein
MRPLPIPSARVRAAHLLALSGFGIAQPAFDRLTRQPEYLAVEGFHALDVVIFGIALLILPPLVMMAIEFLAAFVYRRSLPVVHGLFLGLGVFVVVYHALSFLPVNYAAVASAASALMASRLYRYWQPVRLFLTVAAVGAVFFLGLFLARAPLQELSTTKVQVETPLARSGPPVVLVIFDEFALSSLMTKSGGIDAGRYPTFAALAHSAVWYRNATAVHELTEWAVPAVLTGQLPRHDQLPVLADHPQNIFTLLGPGYRVDAFEALTRMCPKADCPSAERSFPTRLRRVVTHLETYFLTNKLVNDIPAWRDPPSQVSDFLESIRPSQRPQLAVLHVLLPHEPLQYLPSGRKYRGPSIEGYVWDQWSRDEQLVARGYQRYLLQVGYVDLVLKRIIGRLKAEGLWDRSLFIVTADHGVSFRAGEHRRLVNAGNIYDIAPIPLFVKRPSQLSGAIDDRSARSVDIVPTIADVLGIDLPWKVDGRSLLVADRPYPSNVTILKRTGGAVTAPWSTIKAARDEVVAWKVRLFDSGTKLKRPGS